ncbi:MAG: hypothetical protein ACFFAU_18715 [Candidatus Hodarchaeota archaeon]
MPKYDLYRFLNRKALWEKILLLIGCFLYFYVFIISITFSDSSYLIELFIDVLGFQFFIILLYVLFFVFPQITIEKKFNMEELLLSRISVYHYFFEKLLLLVKSIFYPTLAAIITIIILSRSFAYSLVLIIAFVIVQTLYFVSILLFFWRFFATKSLLQSTFLSILGVEIVGYFISNFLFSPDITGYRTTALFFSPLFSSLEMTKLILKSSSDSILYWALWLHLILSISFYFASVVLLKSEVRFE